MNNETNEPMLLIADDNSSVRRVLVQLLASAGLRSVTAANGEQALECARRFMPDLIILDVRMPGRDGFEVCADLRRDALTRNIPVLMLSGMGTLEAERAGAACGADGFLAKPFNFNVLEARVRGLLAGAAS
jgi:DNA-binding response OmpR family regulator